jgi:two-component system, OmpR family, response regulator
MADHVLIIDDDPATRDVIATYLEGQGLRATPVADGRNMKRVLAERPVDLIILDLKLSGEDGLDLMRDVTREREAPIIILTGYRRDETDKVIGLELGADDYMTKPFGLRELLEVLDPAKHGAARRAVLWLLRVGLAEPV